MKTYLIIAKMKEFSKQLSLNRYELLQFLNTKSNIIVVEDDIEKDINDYIDEYSPDIIIYYCLNPNKNAIFSHILIKHFTNVIHIKKYLFVEDFQEINLIEYMLKKYDFSGVIISTKYLNVTQHFTNKYINCFEFDYFINTSIFKDYNKKKTINILLYGCVYNWCYPLRNRLYNILHNMKKEGFDKIYIIDHPGYNNIDFDNCYFNKSLAQLINSSKYVIATSSRYKRMLKKYYEIPLCNSIIIGDYPTNCSSIFKNAIIEINNKMSSSKIKQTLINCYNNYPIPKKKDFLCKYIKQTKSFEQAYLKLCSLKL